MAIGTRQCIRDEDTGDKLFDILGNSPLCQGVILKHDGISYKVERIEIEISIPGQDDEVHDGVTDIFVSTI